MLSCSDWMEPCYDDRPPVPGIDLSSLTADAQYLTISALGALLGVRLIAAAVGALVVLRSVRRDRVARNR